jgi:hypothetical protein
MTPSVEDWAEKVLPGPPRPAAGRAIAIGDWPDGQADASAAHDEHAAVARGPVEHQAVVSLPVQFLASVTEGTAGVSVGSVRSMSSRKRC